MAIYYYCSRKKFTDLVNHRLVASECSHSKKLNLCCDYYFACLWKVLPAQHIIRDRGEQYINMGLSWNNILLAMEVVTLEINLRSTIRRSCYGGNCRG
jgi:hypothetical protein